MIGYYACYDNHIEDGILHISSIISYPIYNVWLWAYVVKVIPESVFGTKLDLYGFIIKIDIPDLTIDHRDHPDTKTTSVEAYSKQGII